MTSSTPVAPSDTDILHVQSAEAEKPPPPWSSFSELLKSDNSSEFAVFKLNQGTSFFTIAACVYVTILLLSNAFYKNTDGVPGALKVIAGMRCCVPLILWTYVYLSSQYVNSNTLTTEGKRILFFGNMSLLLHASFTGATLIGWVLTRDDCQSDVCLQDVPKHILPLGFFGVALVGGFAMTLFFPRHDVYVCFLSMTINTSSLIMSAIWIQVDARDMFVVCVMSMVMFLITVGYEGNMLSIYTAFSKFEIALRANVASENKEYLMKTQTEEMRHMIGMSVCICVYVYMYVYVFKCKFKIVCRFVCLCENVCVYL